MDAGSLWMVVGLGNPGDRYSGNRHNVGFMVVDALCAADGRLRWRPSRRFEADLAEGSLKGRELILVKPQTYMNLSGGSVAPLASFHQVPPSRIVAIHDDVDLELGRIKVKAGGGDGGHKGIRSMIDELGSPDFVRVRLGVGRPELGEVTDHVLSDFSPAEAEEVARQVELAARATEAVITAGVREAMNRYNRAPRQRRGPTDDDSSEQDERITNNSNGNTKHEDSESSREAPDNT